jgi:hypothetical protein
LFLTVFSPSKDYRRAESTSARYYTGRQFSFFDQEPEQKLDDDSGSCQKFRLLAATGPNTAPQTFSYVKCSPHSPTSDMYSPPQHWFFNSSSSAMFTSVTSPSSNLYQFPPCLHNQKGTGHSRIHTASG